MSCGQKYLLYALIVVLLIGILYLAFGHDTHETHEPFVNQRENFESLNYADLNSA